MNKLMIALVAIIALCLGCATTLMLTNAITKTKTTACTDSLRTCEIESSKAHERLAAACSDSPVRVYVCGTTINACLCENIAEVSEQENTRVECTETGCRIDRQATKE